ncbi:MAG: hypothetical protein K9M49_06585 [Candidatus Marinimicrobia bacterium]|nr:hypothetical protein [Candidatus Neomarinimicrobiota bacterium]MCF7850786.1 hypothetical protein [Candidatus Neomarinimicrobiota bacterium]MCF7904804.1 hypothetical protein [Candidatus Neomarinimicrobiota bacterium]
MRKLLALIPVFMLLLSCGWQPTKVNIPAETTFQTVNLVLGDTTTLDLEWAGLVISGNSDPGIVVAELTPTGDVQLIAGTVGESQLSLSYTTEDSEASGYAYFRVVVTDAEYLQLYMGEEHRISLSHYLELDDFKRIDSVVTSGHDSLSFIHFRYEKYRTSLVVTGQYPGTETINFVFLGSSGTQIATLAFNMETIIRKRVLAELFTNAGCVNCPTANENLDQLYEDYPDNFAAIRYHVFWTDPNDPMNLYNPGEVEDRRVYYGSSFEAPRLFIDGVHESDFASYSTLSNVLEQGMLEGSNVHLSYTGLDISSDSLFLDIAIQNFSILPGALMCWTVLTEDSIYYVGTNGEVNHNQAMRDMASSLMSSLGVEQTLSHSLKLTPNFSIDEKYRLLTFVQDLSSKEIHQVLDRSIPSILGN